MKRLVPAKLKKTKTVALILIPHQSGQEIQLLTHRLLPPLTIYGILKRRFVSKYCALVCNNVKSMRVKILLFSCRWPAGGASIQRLPAFLHSGSISVSSAALKWSYTRQQVNTANSALLDFLTEGLITRV